MSADLLLQALAGIAADADAVAIVWLTGGAILTGRPEILGSPTGPHVTTGGVFRLWPPGDDPDHPYVVDVHHVTALRAAHLNPSPAEAGDVLDRQPGDDLRAPAGEDPTRCLACAGATNVLHDPHCPHRHDLEPHLDGTTP